MAVHGTNSAVFMQPEGLVSRGDSFVRYGGMGDVLIHPGTVRDVLAVKGSFDDEQPDLPDLEVTYELTAEEVQLECGMCQGI